MTQQETLEYNKRCAEFLTIHEEIENELVAYPEQQYSPLCSYANAAYICDKLEKAVKYSGVPKTTFHRKLNSNKPINGKKI